jgi:hypothetical protein
VWFHFILLYLDWIYIVAISFIGGINRSTQRKPQICRKSLTNCMAIIKIVTDDTNVNMRPSWLWPYGSWIYNYLCNQCMSPLNVSVRIPLRRGVLDNTICDKVCQRLATSRWFSLGTQVSSTNKTDSHDITEILLKVA